MSPPNPKKPFFSFTRLLSNMVPNFANDSKNDVDLTPSQASSLFKYQLSLSSPRYLDPLSFFIGGVVGSKTVSGQVWKVLIKYGILAALPEGSEGGVKGGFEGERTVFTEKIDKHFANRLAVISVHAQRKVIALLFFWEGECERWDALALEKKGVLVLANGGGISEEERDLRVKSVELRMKMGPGERGEETRNVCQGREGEEGLPVYADGGATAGV